MFYFCIYMIQKQTRRSDKNARQEVLKERIKENNIRHQSVAHKDSFAGNKSIVRIVKKEHHYKESFAFSRFPLDFNLCFSHRYFIENFLFVKYRTDDKVGGEWRSRVKDGWEKSYFLHLTCFILLWNKVSFSLIMSHYQYFTNLLNPRTVKIFF